MKVDDFWEFTIFAKCSTVFKGVSSWVSITSDSAIESIALSIMCGDKSKFDPEATPILFSAFIDKNKSGTEGLFDSLEI